VADFNQILQSFQQQIGAAHAAAREARQEVAGSRTKNAILEQRLERQAQELDRLSSAISQVKAVGPSRSDPMATHIRYVEDIPGRRVPFDYIVNIPIGANITSEQQATATITQDGPFVAVARFAIFQSAYQFSRVDPDTSAVGTFQGRSYGRYRPIHSAWDLNDASAGVFSPVAGGPLPGAGQPIFASSSNHSSFRTMEFDGVINFLNQGSAYPRQNIPIPSAFYTNQINSPFALGALDFFEKSEVLQWKVLPSHANNPNYGNASGYGTGGFFPFLGSQYDVHEGIVDPELEGVQTDPITRVPDGFLIIGFHGYRIIQPPGVAT
jgi:hypothetical protein